MCDQEESAIPDFLQVRIFSDFELVSSSSMGAL